MAVSAKPAYGGDMADRKKIPEAVASKRAGFVSSAICWAISGLILVLPLLLVHSSALAVDFLLYLPNPVDFAAPPLPGEGVLVKKITIKQGDTLAALSRQYSGKGVYYPQILLFNKIRNPDLIYAGQELLVPLPVRLSRKKRSYPSAASRTGSTVRLETQPLQKSVPVDTAETAASSAELRLFEQSVALFTQGNYQDALDSFNSFLKLYPHSPLVPNASLYRADCFLRLSEI